MAVSSPRASPGAFTEPCRQSFGPRIQLGPRACRKFPSSESSRCPAAWSDLTVCSASFSSITRTVRCGCFDRKASIRKTSNQPPRWSSTTLPTPWLSEVRRPSWVRKADSAAADAFPSKAKAPAGPVKVANSSNRCPTRWGSFTTVPRWVFASTKSVSLTAASLRANRSRQRPRQAFAAM